MIYATLRIVPLLGGAEHNWIIKDPLSTDACIGFTEIVCVAVLSQYHFACVECQDCVLLHLLLNMYMLTCQDCVFLRRNIIKELLCACHYLFCWLCLLG